MPKTSLQGYDVRATVLLLLCLSVFLGLAGCSGTQVLNRLTPGAGYQTASNVPFDAASPLRLDVYTPDNAANAPTVIFFYGGRWSGGSKQDFKFVGQALASRGFVAVIPDTRHYPEVRFPTFVEDGAQAVQWARANIGRYGGDPNRLFVMGHSSGAHIAAMLALNESYLKSVNGSRSWLRGMIGLAGPYDFLPLTAPDLRDIFGPPENFALSQPILYADGGNPPLLLLHGEDDDVVWVKNTRNLAQAVAKAGGAVETIIYPRMSHTLIVGSLALLLRGQSDVLDNIDEFVRRQSARAPASATPAGLQTVPAGGGTAPVGRPLPAEPVPVQPQALPPE